VAVVTEPFRVRSPGFFDVTIHLTFDNAKRIVDPDGAIDIEPCDLVSVRVVVAEGPVRVVIRRGGSGRPWREVTLAGDADVTYTAGGPVRTIGDLANYEIGPG